MPRGEAGIALHRCFGSRSTCARTEPLQVRPDLPLSSSQLPGLVGAEVRDAVARRVVAAGDLALAADRLINFTHQMPARRSATGGRPVAGAKRHKQDHSARFLNSFRRGSATAAPSRRQAGGRRRYAARKAQALADGGIARPASICLDLERLVRSTGGPMGRSGRRSGSSSCSSAPSLSEARAHRRRRDQWPDGPGQRLRSAAAVQGALDGTCPVGAMPDTQTA
jgi:hypothetical protein